MHLSILFLFMAMLLLQQGSSFALKASRRLASTQHSRTPLSMLLDVSSVSSMTPSLSLLLADGEAALAASSEPTYSVGYSNYSLYFTLFLYVLSLPGLYSLVTRSVKVKTVQKTYDIPGPANPTAKPVRQTAAEVMAYFKAMNYEVATAEEVITFKGMIGKSKSQAAFLTFCTFMGLGSLALVLSILSPDVVGAKAYAITLFSPYAGIFYWNNAQRIDEVKIKMETSDDEQLTSIIAEGGKEDLERFAKRLGFLEKGKVYQKGIFDDGELGAGAGAPSA